ncbi:MAG: hypothetical protein AAF438_08365 [Pseudomonadota bacterium]
MSPRLGSVPDGPPTKTEQPEPSVQDSKVPWQSFLFLGLAAAIGFFGGRSFVARTQQLPDEERLALENETISTELLPEVQSKDRAFEGLDEHHVQLQAQLESRQEEIARLKLDLAHAGDELEEPKQEIHDLKIEVSELHDQLLDQAKKHEEDLEESSEQRTALKEEKLTLLEQIGQLETQLDEESQKQIHQKQQIDELCVSNESLQAALSQAAQASAELKREHEDKLSELSESFEQSQQDIGEELEQKEARIEYLMGRQDELENAHSVLDDNYKEQGVELEHKLGEIASLQSSIDQLREQQEQIRQTADQEIGSLKELLRTKSSDLEVALQRGEASEEEISNARGALKTEIERADSIAASAAEAENSLQSKLDALGIELEEHRTTSACQHDQLTQVTEENHNLRGALESVRQDLAKASSHNVNQIAQRQNLDDTIEEKTKALSVAETKIRQQTVELLNAEQELSSQSEELTKLRAEVSDIQEKEQVAQSWLARAESAENELSSNKEALTQLQAHLSDAEQEQEKAQSWLLRAETAEEELNSAHEEVAAVNDASKELEQDLLQARKEIEGLTGNLEASKLELNQLRLNDGEKDKYISQWLSNLTEISYKSDGLPLSFKPEPENAVRFEDPQDLVEPLKQLENLLDGIAAQNDDLSADVIGLRTRAEKAEDIVSSSTEELDLLRTTSTDLNDSLSEARREIESVTELLRQREADLDRVGSVVNERQKTVDSIQLSIQTISDKIHTVHIEPPQSGADELPQPTTEDLTPLLDDLDQLLGKVDAQRVRWSNDAKQWHERASRAESELEGSENELRTLKDGYSTVIAELNDSKDSLTELRQAMQQKQQVVDELSATSVLQRDNMTSYIAHLASTVDKMGELSVSPTAMHQSDSPTELPDMTGSLDELDRLLSQVEQQNLVMSERTTEADNKLQVAQSEVELQSAEHKELKETYEQLQRSLATTQSEVTNLKRELTHAQAQAKGAQEINGQVNTQHIAYLSTISKVNNKLAGISIPTNQANGELLLAEIAPLTPALDTLESMLGDLQRQTKKDYNDGGPRSLQIKDLEKTVASHETTIQRLKRGIDQLRHYQDKVKSWNSTIDGYRADIKRKTDVIDGLRDQNMDLRKLENVVAERDKSIATLVTALKHDGTNIRKLKRRLGKWKRRCVMLENSLRASGMNIVETNGKNTKEPASDKTIRLSTDRDRPKGKAPGWVNAPIKTEAQADDLTRIDGVDNLLAETLNQLGIFYFSQLAAFDENDINWLAYLIDSFPTRIHKGKWVEKAKALTRSAATG